MRIVVITICSLLIAWLAAKASDRASRCKNTTQEVFWQVMCVMAALAFGTCVLIWALLPMLPLKH